MATLNLLPPLFKDTVYFANVYFTTTYTLFTFLSISIPFIFTGIRIPKRFQLIYKVWNNVSLLLGGWFFAGLIAEIINFKFPEITINDIDSDWIYIKFMIGFTVGLAFILTHYSWIKEQKR